MLTPQQCEWFKTCVFPWGYETPSASMLAYFITLDFNNNNLAEENRKLINQLSEKERELILFKAENGTLKCKLENSKIDNEKIESFFSSIESIDEAWEVLEESIYKIEKMQMKPGAFSGFADTVPDDPVEKGNGNPENYWMKKYGEEKIRNHYFGNKTITYQGNERRAKKELEILQKQFQEFRNNCTKTMEKLCDENWIMGQKIENSYFEINLKKKKIKKLKEEIKEKDELIKYLRKEIKQNIFEYKQELIELKDKFNKMDDI